MKGTRLAEGSLCSDDEFDCYRSDAPGLMEALKAVCGEKVSGWVRTSRDRYRATGTSPSGETFYVDVLRST